MPPSEPSTRIVVDYELLPTVFDPEVARAPGAPLVHGDKSGPTSRIDAPDRNTVAELHGERGNVDAAIEAADAVATGTWTTSRVSHVALETHATRGWLDADGRLVLRTSSQVPYLVRDEIARIFDRSPETVRVFTKRVGGGFGGKQEILTEDLVALAVLHDGSRRCSTSSRAPRSSCGRRCGIRCGSRSPRPAPPTGC